MRVLLVDDDPKLRDYLARGLEEEGIRCAVAASADEAQARIDAERPGSFELVLLDVMMPGRSGWEFLEELRRAGDRTPVIFLTARQSVEERIRGLKLGADDYVLKPFSFGELLARIEAVGRRSAGGLRLESGGIVLDPLHRVVERDGRRIELSPREFELLHVLIENEGRVLSREDLLRRVWGIHYRTGTNVVDVAIARLRRRIDVGRDAPLLHTVVGEGYCFGPRRGASA